MFIVRDLGTAIALCVVTMLGWGSWANTQKLAGKDKWPFQLYYWDYAVGVFVLGLVFLFTLGSIGASGMTGLENLSQAGGGAIGRALFSGVLFNISNILLVVAIDAVGMSVAFPVGVGLALVIGTVVSYVQTPKGSSTLLFGGVGLVVLAMIMSAIAYSKLPRKAGHGWARGVIFAVIAGCLMGSFYPQLIGAVSPDFNSAPIEAGKLTPYAALAIFGLGLLLSNFAVNTVFIKAAGLSYSEYFRGSIRLHSLGFVGGMIWMLALSANVVASGVAGPAISYALGQGATLVAAIWGVLIWREFREAPRGTMPYVISTFVGYAVGLTLIGVATL
ncbi:MAG: multidrug DMT transporter permease [Acidobacteriia bacterium]|nr:multidrug DMT transporter permease [Terriglobia bacterium]